MRSYLLTIFLLCISFISNSQSGDFYLKHFTIDIPNVDNDNYAIIQDEQGRMRIANRKGLLKFDGTFWGITHTPGTVFSVKYDAASKYTFVGCINDFGYIETDATGTESYVSISKGDPLARNIAKIEVFGDIVYFLGENIMYKYSLTHKKIITVYNEHITNLFSFKNQIYACHDNTSITKLGAKSPTHEFQNAPSAHISFTVSINAKSVLVGTSDNRLLILSDHKFTPLILADSSYIQHSEILDAIVLNEENAIIATAKGGCVIINLKNGQTKSIVNVYSGLPDDEVYAIGKDKNGGIWIAHEFGISRTDYNLPFLCLSNYLGWEGHLETALSYNGKLYIGTNEGLFVLEEIKQYKEMVEKKVVLLPFDATDKNIDDSQKQKKERFNFRNLLRRKPKKQDQNLVKKENIVKKLILEAIKHTFVRVGNITAKCNQIIKVGDKLIAATNSGIYEIKGSSIGKLCNNNIRYLYASKNNSRIFASTTDGNVLTFVWEGGKWVQKPLLDFIDQPITCIAEDVDNNIWLTGINKVYKVTISSKNILQTKKEISINNPYSDDIYIFNYRKKTYFSISSDFYYYEPIQNSLIIDRTLRENYKNSEKVIYSQNDVLWLFKNKYWEYLSDDLPQNNNFIYLSLFRNVEEFIVDKAQKTVWVITDKNQLYGLDLNGTTNALSKPEILVHNVKNAKGEFLAINNFAVEKEEGNLLLSIVSPDYYNQNALDYQYKIVGHNEEWSEWSNNNTIFLNYLPSGDYVIYVRSRNAFGIVNEKETVTFTIKPPFWQTWWFYLFEILFFGTLWVLSFRLNRTSNTNDAIRKALTFMTLVITIEFLSTVAENTMNLNISPVLDFLVKVCIAMSLVPIETFLRRFIIRDKLGNPQKSIFW